ncbi:hypothetical protein ABID65_009095 [Bradyrhizobium sp. S3.9.2]|uniref:hypothetical protein n=1 Tax=unclassified Bradyrhizobium TaxID=2631580 RepID=UPI003398E4A3
MYVVETRKLGEDKIAQIQTSGDFSRLEIAAWLGHIALQVGKDTVRVNHLFLKALERARVDVARVYRRSFLI